MGSTPISLSASRGAAILGVSKYRSPLQAWLEIMESMKPGFCDGNGFLTPVRKDPWAEPHDPKLASLRWGLAFEDAICELVGGITDREAAFACPDDDFITCHIDGLKKDVPGKPPGIRLQENKTAMEMAYKMGWGDPGTEMIPIDYTTQINHQMMCTGITEADVNVLVFPKAPAEWEKQGYRVRIGGLMQNEISHFCHILKTTDNPNTFEEQFNGIYQWAKNLGGMGYFHKYHVIANPAAQKEMLDRYREFWHVNVEKEIPPPVQGYNDIKWLIASPEGELEASQEIKEAWSEYIDIDMEIDSMVKRKEEIKDIFAGWTARELASKKIREGAEKGKLNVYAGARKLFSISRPKPGIRVSGSTVSTIKEDSPEQYERMKKTSFADILGDISLTEKQAEKKDELDKFLGKLKLTKLLSSKNIMSQIEKAEPELYKTFFEHGIITETEPTSRLNINKPKE